MPVWPGEYAQVKVGGTFKDAFNQNREGSVIIYNKQLVIDATGKIIIPIFREEFPLVNGAFETSLLATNDPRILPQNFRYVIIFNFVGGAEWEFEVPKETPGGELDLSTAVPLGDGQGSSISVLYDLAGSAAAVQTNLEAQIATHSADTTAVHGIADTSLLETIAGAIAKISAHSAAADPHGDRSWASGIFATITALDTTNGTVTVLNGFLDDIFARLSSIENGTAFLAGLNSTGPVRIIGADLSIEGTGKGYRFRRGGGALDLEAGGADLVISNWSAGDFTGTQRQYFRLSADAQNVQAAGKIEFVDVLYGATWHVLDGAANQAGFFGADPVGRQTVSGSWSDGTAGASLAAAMEALGFIVDDTTP